MLFCVILKTVKIVKVLDFKENINLDDIEMICQSLNFGKICVLPTDTVYGIGASIKNSNAIEKLYKVKNRNKSNRINILVSSKNMAKKYVKNYNLIADKLIDSFWPGALTIVFRKNDNVPNEITANTNTVGIRMCDNIVTNKIIEKLNVPLAVPSANKSNRPSGTNIYDIMSDFSDDVDIYIDYGNSKIGIESTIVEINDDNQSVKILRKGKITKQEIEALGIKVLEDDLKDKHYMLNINTKVVYNVEKLKEVLAENNNKRIAIIGFEYELNFISNFNTVEKYSLGRVSNLEYAMKNIYKILRSVEKEKYDLCVIVCPKKTNETESILRILEGVK